MAARHECNVSTLRAKGFSIVKLAGPVTCLKHEQPFAVNGKPARQVADRYEFNVRGWFGKYIKREIDFI